MKDATIIAKWVQLRDSALSRGIEFDLSFNKVKKLLAKKRCYYSNQIFVDEKNHPLSRTIDRVDSTKGYIDTNIIVCCKDINAKKGNLTIDEIKQLYKGINKHKNDKISINRTIS